MKITPHVNLLRSLRGERIDYVLLVGEGIDNAFDAAANIVRVTIENDEVSFKDDGVGIDRDHIASVFSLGDHGRMATTQLGRFGIGIKAQAVNAGNVFYVESTSKDGHVYVEVDWQKILRSGEWTIEDPRWKPVVVGKPTGTMISIAQLRKAPQVTLDRIASQVSLRFHPAIAAGKKIYLNGARVGLLDEPRMMDIIEKKIQLSEGRGASIRAGVLSQPSKLHHVHVGYGHRVIMPESSLGCGQYGGLNKMFARVHLHGKWHLAKFKDDLTDEQERDELEEAIEHVLQPILEKCSSASMSAKIIEIGNALNSLLPPKFSGARPKRERERNPGEKKSKKSGVVDANKSENDGPARSKRPPDDKLLITFDGVAEQDGIGSFARGNARNSHRVNLSREHPDVAMLIEYRERKFAVRCLYMMAISIFLVGIREYGAQLSLFDDNPTFGQQVAKLLSMQGEDEIPQPVVA